MHGSEPPDYTPPDYTPPADTTDTTDTADQPTGASGYGLDPAQALVEVTGDDGIEPANIHACAHGLYAAAYEDIGGFGADDVFTGRFVRRELLIAPGELQRQTCDHIERERRRFPHDDRNRVLRQLFGDPRLDGYIARLADACVALGLSGCPGCGPAATVAAPSIARRRIEDLQRYASDAGAGVVGLVAKEATIQMIEFTNILDHADIGAYVPGRDLIDRIVWLTPPEERPTAQEARRTMTLGSIARRLVSELASEAGRLDTTSDGEVETICELAIEYQFVKGTIGMDVDEVTGRGRRATDEAADEHERKVIYFRGGRSA